MKTRFPHHPEYIRPILDDFLAGLREQMRNSEYFPGPEDLRAWSAGARKLYNNFSFYKPGFAKWAVREHCKRIPECRYINSPWSLRYLWDDYVPLEAQELWPDDGEVIDMDALKNKIEEMEGKQWPEDY